MYRLVKEFSKDRNSPDSDKITVTMDLDQDDAYLNGVFTVSVTSKGEYSQCKAVLDFNATEFYMPWYNNTIPSEFNPLELDTSTHQFTIVDPNPIWFFSCKMHCDMKY
ncbi:hypothetical protein BGZ97_008854 [Linnemannia gamsii]|uniref:Uncharacterized protein n=1 Tax=Linnemannia gamsii TaxID=64522 RepID=A0A9P6RCH1_9FUNG|nr:hypothetical protein BGZ97_008854 [Linnemannia gamsii]